MKQIRFRIRTQDDLFYKALRARVTTYLRSRPNEGFGNWLMVLKGSLFLTLYWGVYATILLGGFSAQNVVLLYGLLGMLGLLVAFNLSHDAVHGTLTRFPKFNKAIYYLSFNPLGTDAYLWQIRHLKSHHLYPNVDDCDADIDSNFLIRLSPNRPLLPHHRWQHVYAPFLYAFYTLQWVFIKDLSYLFRKNLANLRQIKHPWVEVLGFFLFKAFYFWYLIYVPINNFHLPWQTVLVGFLVFRKGTHFSSKNPVEVL